MPVTARLSKLFYDRLGEEIANELVEWFNAVDATYRADLRELNELNFSRFDAKLGALADRLEGRLEARLNALEDRLESRLEARLEARLNATMEARFAKLTRWLFATMMVAWAGLFATLVGIGMR